MESSKENNRLAALEAYLERSAAENAEFKRMHTDALREMQKMREFQAKTSLEIDKLRQAQAQTDKQIGGMSNNQGAETTEFFYNSFKYGDKKMFGEEFDEIFTEEKRKTKKGFEDEYDILLFNGRAVCVVEVKYKADTSDVQDVLRKERTFRANFPEHNDKKLYLALASKTLHRLTEKACKDNGIAIIKQVGNTIAIHDENMKVF